MVKDGLWFRQNRSYENSHLLFRKPMNTHYFRRYIMERNGPFYIAISVINPTTNLLSSNHTESENTRTKWRLQWNNYNSMGCSPLPCLIMGVLSIFVHFFPIVTRHDYVVWFVWQLVCPSSRIDSVSCNWCLGVAGVKQPTIDIPSNPNMDSTIATI